MATTFRVAAGNIAVIFLNKHAECQCLAATGIDGMPGGHDALRHCQKAAHAIARQTGQQHPLTTIFKTHLQIIGPRGNGK